MQFVDYDTYKKMMNTTGLAAVHDACANYTTLQFQTQRGIVPDASLRLIWLKLFSFFLLVRWFSGVDKRKYETIL